MLPCLTSRNEEPLVNNSDDLSSGRLKLFTFHGGRGGARLAGEPGCCYKEQWQRECLLKTQRPHSCGRTHAIALHESQFSSVPLLVERRAHDDHEEAREVISDTCGHFIFTCKCKVWCQRDKRTEDHRSVHVFIRQVLYGHFLFIGVVSAQQCPWPWIGYWLS